MIDSFFRKIQSFLFMILRISKIDEVLKIFKMKI